jgi:hypothetical protein
LAHISPPAARLALLRIRFKLTVHARKERLSVWFAHEKGLPETKTALVSLVQDWFSEASAGRSAGEAFPDVAARFLGILAHRCLGRGGDALLRAVGQLASVGEASERRFLLRFLVQFVRIAVTTDNSSI